MDKYQIGKDIQNIESRLQELETTVEALALANCTCGENREPEEIVRFAKEESEDLGAEIGILRSRFWNFGNDTTGSCELKGSPTLVVYSDGTWRASGTLKCNAGNILSCRMEIRASFYIGGDDQCKGVTRVSSNLVIEQGLLPRGDLPFERDFFDRRLRDEFNNLTCASFWVSRCRTGLG